MDSREFDARALSNPTLIVGDKDTNSEDSIKGKVPKVTEYGDLHAALYGPTGEPIFPADGSMAVRMRRWESEAIEWTIPNGDSISSEIGIDGISMGIVIMPVGWTAAGITLQVGEWSNGSFFNLYDENGSEVVLTVAAGRAVPLPPEVVAASFIKIRSGTAGTPVNQAAQRTGHIVAKG